MISVVEVDKRISSEILNPATEKVLLDDATGRVLKQQVSADRDFPPFDRVMMDGIAIQFARWELGQRSFKVEGLCAAGAPKGSLQTSDACLEVMTGAVLPENTDTVVKYEEVTLKDGFAIIDDKAVLKIRQHVHARGTDRKENEVLIEPGRKITGAEVAILATVGYSAVEVTKQPKIAVLATGDELVEVTEAPLPHQIRKSNVHALVAALKEASFPAETFHFKDSKDELRVGLKKILGGYDVLILSGGVSKGKLDFVPEILTELGVEKQFHFVKQRPGKPFWFGRYKKGEGHGVVFALPGNPVSTFVGLHRYVIPFLNRSTGMEAPAVFAKLAADYTFTPNLTYFLQVTLSYNMNGELLAMPVPGRGSGDLANLLDADAFLELPDDRSDFKAGEVFRCWMYRR